VGGASIVIPFTYTDDEGDEITAQLPSMKEVCDDCQGEGRTLNENLRGAFTQEGLREFFDDDESLAEYKKGGHGIYGVECKTCKGLRVIDVLDEGRCDKKLLKLYQQSEQDDAEYEQICNMARAMGA
jgi:hypothetical protein